LTVEPKDEYYENQEQTHTLGKSMGPVVIASYTPVYWKAGNLTSLFYPNVYPNPPQHHPTQTDTPRRRSPGYPRLLGHHPT
jgi:hypothetical protein